MESLYLLIPISIIFIVIALSLYFWAVNSGQYEDLDAEGERLLFDNEDDVVVDREKVEHKTDREKPSD